MELKVRSSHPHAWQRTLLCCRMLLFCHMLVARHRLVVAAATALLLLSMPYTLATAVAHRQSLLQLVCLDISNLAANWRHLQVLWLTD